MENGACSACRKQLTYITGPTCFRCGKMSENEEDEYCGDCIRLPKSYKRGYPVFLYNEIMRESIADFKYNNKREYSHFYGEEILARYNKEFKRIGFDAILPVPVHKAKKRRRGFNQAELVAKVVGKGLNIPVITDLIVRTKNTAPQKELDDKARMKNLKSAFKLVGNEVQLDRVLLVDDIYTSGATIEAISRLLVEQGTEVYYTSICIGKGQ